MQYQSFPGVRGGSQSLPKLVALRLPALAGKRFLDVGCNEGYFCGYALREGAETVVGLDKSAAAIQKAQRRFPQGQFHRQSWESLPKGPFDVVTLLSALHYADDQEALVHRLMALLSDDGLLVLEISIAPDGGDKWVKVKRSIDERFFPTRVKLGTVLQDYAWKVIGHSVNQAGDPLQRYVVHVRKMRPYAYLMMETPGSGKSTISRRLFKQAKVPVVGGDRVYLQVSEGKHEASEALRQAVSEGFTTASIDKVTARVFEGGLADELVDLWVKQAGKHDFALDSYVPESHREAVRDALFRKGYFPVDLNWTADADLMTPARSIDKASDYETWLGKQARLDTQPSLNVSRLLPDALKPSIRWHLDHPVSGQLFVEDGAMKVAGWVVTFGDYQQLLQLYVETARGRRLFEFDRSRKDVLNAVFGSLEATPPFWQDQPCGFSFEVTKEDVNSGFEIGLVVNQQSIPLAQVSLEGAGNGGSRRLGARLFKQFRKL